MVMSLLVAFPGLRRQPIAQIGIMFSADPTQTRAGGLVARIRDPPMIIRLQFPCDTAQSHHHNIVIAWMLPLLPVALSAIMLQTSAAWLSLPRPT